MSRPAASWAGPNVIRITCDSRSAAIPKDALFRELSTPEQGNQITRNLEREDSNMPEKVCTKNPAAAVAPLADMIKNDDPETRRAGKRQLWEMVRHVGRPGNAEQASAVTEALLKLLASDQPAMVKREAVWAVSELGGNECVDPIAALLADKDLREDACMVLERLPGDKPVEALKAALKTVPPEFVINVAHSLRARGIPADGPPCQKLKPTKQTEVKPVGRA